MRKNKMVVWVLLVILVMLSGCTKPATPPKTVTVDDRVDYFAELKMIVKSEAMGERILMLPVHIYYDQEKDEFSAISMSNQTVTTPEGLQVDFDIQGVSKSVKKGEPIYLELMHSSLVKDGNKKGPIIGEPIKIDLVIDEMDKDKLVVSHKLNGVQAAEPLEFKIKEAQK